MRDDKPMVRIADSDGEIGNCFDVLAELRPHLVRDRFVAGVREMQREGYELAYLAQDGRVTTVAGFRVATNFHVGRHLYVNDLVTAAATRSQGHGALMLSWLRERARAAGCAAIDLDSGTQRAGAHRFYFAQGFHINCYHFIEALHDD